MLRYSVVVPAFNAEASLASCLESLGNQSTPDAEFEVIVVDDGSQDQTAALAKSFPVRYERQPNSGPATARNHGARLAQGEIILFTDADCVPTSTWIEEMVKPFTDPDVSGVKGAYRTDQRELTARFAQIEFEERFELLSRVESIDMVDTYSAAYRATVFRDAGGFDESFPVANNEDTDLSYRLVEAGHRLVFTPAAIVYHLNHPDSVSRYARLKFWRGYWRMLVYDRFPAMMLRDTYTPKTLKLQTVSILGAAGLLLLSPIIPYSLIPAGLAVLAFLLLAAPFTAFALARDVTVGVLSPLFLALRGLSIGSGILYFYLTRLFKARRTAQ